MTGLNKQTHTLNFGQGVDSKTDPKLVAPGKLTLLENGVFKKTGRIDKRNGYTQLANIDLSGNALSSGAALAIYRDELLQYNKQHLYSYSQGSEKWLDKGAAVSSILESRQVISNTYLQAQVDSAVTNGVGVYAWEDSRGGVRASVRDETSGTTILNDVSLDASASRVRCFAFSSYLYVFYYKSGSLYVQRLNPTVPTAFDTAVTVVSNINTANPNYDVASVDGIRIFIVYNYQTSSAVRTVFLDAGPTVLSGALAPATLVAEAATNCLAIVQGSSLNYFVAYHNGSNGLRALVVNNGGGAVTAAATLDSTTSPVAVNVTGYLKRNTTTVQFLYEVNASATYNHLVKQNTLTQSGVAGSAAVFLRGVGLWSKAFSYDDPNDSVERGFVGLSYSSSLQSTYFIARNDGYVCAKMQPGLGSGLTTRPILQNVATLSAAKFQFSLLNKTRLVSDNATLFSQTGVAKTSIDFGSSDAFNFAELGSTLHIVGGVLSMYDGVSVVEHGFHLYPENITLTETNNGAGALANGTYEYSACFEWKDNNGNIHKSAPSVPVSITVASGPSDVSVAIPTLRLTSKTGARTNVVLQVYRTQKNATVFYRSTSVASPTFNDPTADSVTYTDTVTDTLISSNDILYTVGGELDNTPAPACSYINVFKNRIFLAGLEDPTLIWYSKINSPGNPVEFAAELTQNVDPQGGGLTALGVLDDKQVIFKQDRFYITYGDGPNNNGELGEFAQPQFVSSDVGCTSSNSVVRVPEGLMFKTAKGIYTLGSNLSVQYTGAEVEDFNSLTVTSATLKSDVNQVRFTTSDGSALVWDYYFRQWSTFTNHLANDSLIWQKQFVLLKTDGFTYVENPGLYKDNLTSYSLRIGTAWLSFDSVTGFQRIYDLAFLGEYVSSHVLRCQIGYDFSSAYLSTIIFSPDTSIPVSTYGDGAAYGSTTPYGGDNNAYRWKASLAQQKCQSIRFLFEDLVTAATSGTQSSFTITSMGLQLGIKGHLGRMKGDLSIGTQGVS